jgi:hypothetical protein
LIIAVVPTVYVVWTAWRVNQPVHVRDVEVELGRRLNLPVSLKSVRYPRPGLVVYEGVVIRHEEAPGKGAPTAVLASADTARLRVEGRELTVELDGLKVHATSPRQAVAQVNSMLRLANGKDFDRIHLSAHQCELDLGSGVRPYALGDVAGTLEVTGAAPTITASFKIKEENVSPRCELTLTRDRNGETARTVLAFKTMDGQAVTAHVLDPFFGAESWLGRAAHVEGELRLSQIGTADWDATFQGSLLEVDLAALVGKLAPEQRITGLARVTFQSAKWADQARGSGWIEAEGQLVSGPGHIGSEFLRSLQSRLKFRLDRRVDVRRTGDWEFQALGLTFGLSRSGEIQIGGGLGAEFLPGAVIVQAQRATPLVSAPEGVATVAGLIRTLVPGDDAKPDQLIPASFESQALQRYLPVRPSEAGSRDIPHAN